MPPKADNKADFSDLMKKLTDWKDDMNKKLDLIKEDTALNRKTLENIELSVKQNSDKISVHDNDISFLKSAVNDKEQHSRNSSIRILGLKLNENEARDAVLTAKVVYTKILQPILNLAVKEDLLSSIPAYFELIEHCHTLKAKPGSTKPAAIICRFQSRLVRQLVFKFKRQAMSDPDLNLSSISIVEDLTSANFKKLMSLRDKDIKCWSFGGHIYYVDADDNKKRMK